MIEIAKELDKDQKIIRATQIYKKQGKQTIPASQEIVQQLVKINGEKANKLYKKMCFLGKGGFAQCFLTKQIDNSRTAATKIIPKKLLDSHRTKLRLANQIKLHKYLHHENVVEFYNNFQDQNNVYINLQVCQYGSINDLIRTRFTFTPPQVQSFMYGICHGLKYLHSKGIIHRDLKLGNIFLDSNLKAKIGDFGLACKLQFMRELKRTVCGTPNYIAPQVLQGKGYHFQVDTWALGVMLYTLFFTFPPFETEQPHTTYQKIRKCQYQFPRFIEAPQQALDLIRKLLVPDPAKRLTIDQVLESPFMKMGSTIPIGLPLCSIKRPPNKKQLAAWPKIEFKVEQNCQKQSNTTVLGFFGISKKNQKSILKEKTQIFQRSIRPSLNKINSQYKPTVQIFCKNLDQVSSQLITFYLNNGNLGIYQVKKNQVYTCQLKDKSEKIQQIIKKLSLNSSGAIKEQQIQYSQCPHKVILNIKHKQLLQSKAQVLISNNVDKDVTIQKINIYKDVKMVRMSNRTIQVIYKQNDGFLLSSNRKNVFYFYSFTDLEIGVQVSISQILQQKQNLNGSFCNSITSIFKQKKAQKNYLTNKKINYLKIILKESINKVFKRNH